MALRKRAPGLICLLLVSAAAILLAGRPTAATVSAPDGQDAVQTLEEDMLQYGEQSPVQILSLQELEPADTAAEHVFRGGGENLFLPADPAEMAEILAELDLNDGTGIRLYATAEGLVFGAFLRPGGQWTRFVRLYGGEGDMAAAVQNLSLTPFSGILGKEGFVLRHTARDMNGHSYFYCWFDRAGDLQVLTARLDPVALDLNGDSTAELAWEIAGLGASFYCQDADGVIYQVTPADYIHSSSGAALVAVEREGPGPARLIYRCRADDRERFCAVTLEGDQLRVEEDIVYVPARTSGVPLPADPTEKMTVPVRVSVTGPDGQGVRDAGDTAAREFRSMLWEGDGVRTEGAVITPTDAPLDEAAAYTVTFTPETGEPVFWTLDDQGVCRLSGLEGNYRLISTGLGSLPARCPDTMEPYCRTARPGRSGGA